MAKIDENIRKRLIEIDHIVKTNCSKCNEFNLIKEIIELRDIHDVYHFTNVDNLENILEFGIMDKDSLQKLNIEHKQNDSDRFDLKTNCTSFSLSFPNSRLLKSKENANTELCIIELDIDGILEEKIKNNKVWFCNVNAAKNNCKMGQTAEDFNRMFCNPKGELSFSVKPTNEGKHFKEDSALLELTYDEQAEMLIEGRVDPKYIRKIYFKTKSGEEKYSALCKRFRVEASVCEPYFMFRNYALKVYLGLDYEEDNNGN